MMDSWRRLFQTVGKKKAKDMRREEDTLHKTLVNTGTSLQTNPGNEHAQISLATARDALGNI